MQALRIVTINTGKGDGSYRARIEWMAQELVRLQPDVVALQESFRDASGLLDTAEAVRRRLGLHLSWAPARFKPRTCEGREVESWSGVALLSRMPWAQVDTIELPSDPEDGDRVAQVGCFEVDYRPFVIANLHLTHLRDRDDLRREQLQRVLEHPALRSTDAIRIVCGDFNTTMQDAVLRDLLGVGAFGSIIDTYVSGGGPRDRATLQTRPGSTEPARCVDHILSLAPAAAEQPVFKSSDVVLKRLQPGSGLLPSDHFGVATTVLPLRTSHRVVQEQSQFA